MFDSRFEITRNKNYSLAIAIKVDGKAQPLTLISTPAQVLLLTNAFNEMSDAIEQKECEYKKRKMNLIRKLKKRFPTLPKTDFTKDQEQNIKNIYFLETEALRESRQEFENLKNLYEGIKTIREVENKLAHNQTLDENLVKKLDASWSNQNFDLELEIFSIWYKLLFRSKIPAKIDVTTAMVDAEIGEKKLTSPPMLLRLFIYYTYRSLYDGIREKLKIHLVEEQEIQEEFDKDSNAEIIEEFQQNAPNSDNKEKKENVTSETTYDEEMFEEFSKNRDKDREKEKESEEKNKEEKASTTNGIVCDEKILEEFSVPFRKEYERKQKERADAAEKEMLAEFSNDWEAQELMCKEEERVKPAFKPCMSTEEKERIRDQEIQNFINQIKSSLDTEIQNIKVRIEGTNYGKSEQVVKLQAWQDLQSSLEKKTGEQSYIDVIVSWKQGLIEKPDSQKQTTRETFLATHRRCKFFQIFTKTKSTETLEAIIETANFLDKKIAK